MAKEADKPFGFYKTKEGLAVLQEAYRRFNALPGAPKDGKVALIVSGSKYDPKQVKAALDRWRKGRKVELWANDIVKSNYVARKLEQLLAAEPDIAPLLEEEELAIHKREVGESLSVLFYGARRRRNEAEIAQLLRLMEGLYFVEEDSWGSNRFHRDFYVFYRRPADASFLLVHEFAVSRRSMTGIDLTYWRSGFAYPTATGELHRFIIDHDNPGLRVFDVLKEVGRPIGEELRIHFRRDPRLVDANLVPFLDPDDESFHRREISYVIERNEELQKYIEDNMWNIVILSAWKVMLRSSRIDNIIKAPEIVRAALDGDHEKVDHLLQSGVSVNTLDERDGISLLHIACIRNDHRLADVILEWDRAHRDVDYTIESRFKQRLAWQLASDTDLAVRVIRASQGKYDRRPKTSPTPSP